MGYDDFRVQPAGTYAAFGTNAAAADIIRVVIPKSATVNALKIAKSAGTDATTGAFTVSKSAAGTGAAAAFGTAAITGTSAASSIVEGTVTTTAFDADDVLIVSRTAGTSASITQASVEYWFGL